ncbi:MAG: ATP-binding cassette domain-containing protein [Methanomicrobiales archaeon]|nr:ATP-binding cassette domain-containing protein [Methanomicrobiales archaeon]
MTDTIIEVRDLSHWYGDLKAVDSVGFSVEKGEIFSFLGPNGAGKSTVINILITLLPIQSGEAKIAGYDVTREPEKVRSSIGIVFQETTLDRDMTVSEILEFHGRLYSMPVEVRRSRIDDLLALVELEAKRDTLTKHLSGGMKRRLEMARGLMTRPLVLFLDEPTLGLDPQTRMKTWEYIRNVNKEGTTIFLTTHYMDEADRLSDRISIIDHGRIVTTGSPLELKNLLGEDIIFMETDDDTRAGAVIKGEKGIRSVQKKEKGVLALVQGDGTKILPIIMERVLQAGIGIQTVNLKKPSMDDVFVHFTGREIRDGGSGGPSPRSADRKRE